MLAAQVKIEGRAARERKRLEMIAAGLGGKKKVTDIIIKDA